MNRRAAVVHRAAAPCSGAAVRRARAQTTQAGRGRREPVAVQAAVPDQELRVAARLEEVLARQVLRILNG